MFEPVDLCQEVMLARAYRDLSLREKRDPKSLSPEQRKLVVQMERAAGLT